MENNLRMLPKVDDILNDKEIIKLSKLLPHNRITAIIRTAIDSARKKIINGEICNAGKVKLREIILTDILAEADLLAGEGLRKVINATGIIIHTNLGRAPLSCYAAEKIAETAANYSNLEYGVSSGTRRSRLYFIEKMLMDLTGAEAALVVNNNASAIYLALNTFCIGKEVILSRGEIIEIGDSFRISEIIESSGCKIKETGTTNKTKLTDYEKSINENTGLLMKAHTSNFTVCGFTESVPPAALCKLARGYGLPVLEDMGSGVLVNLTNYGFKYERMVQDAVCDGVDIITFSGDKMLGASQAGIIAGKKIYIDAMRRNPLMRCLRADKLCLAALEATLTQLNSYEESLNIPVLKYLAASESHVLTKAEQLLNKITKINPFLNCRISAHTARFGGGSLPSEDIESYALYISSKIKNAAAIEKQLRGSKIPIIATIFKGEVVLDARTIDEDDFDYIAYELRPDSNE